MKTQMLTRTLFGAGALGPVIFILTFLVDGALRPGYSWWRNFVSQLATGDGGWVQTLNFLMLGTFTILFVVGLIRARVIGPAFFLTVYALALLVAGVFPTDPGLGYPPGAPEIHTTSGTIHGFAGLFVFLMNAFAAFAAAIHFRRREPAFAVGSLLAGVGVLALFFASFAVGQPDGPTGLFQRVTIIVGFTWVAAFAYRMWTAADEEARSTAQHKWPHG